MSLRGCAFYISSCILHDTRRGTCRSIVHSSSPPCSSVGPCPRSSRAPRALPALSPAPCGMPSARALCASLPGPRVLLRMALSGPHSRAPHMPPPGLCAASWRASSGRMCCLAFCGAHGQHRYASRSRQHTPLDIQGRSTCATFKNEHRSTMPGPAQRMCAGECGELHVAAQCIAHNTRTACPHPPYPAPPPTHPAPLTRSQPLPKHHSPRTMHAPSRPLTPPAASSGHIR